MYQDLPDIAGVFAVVAVVGFGARVSSFA